MIEPVVLGADPDEMPFVPAMIAHSGRTVYLSGAGAIPLIHKHPHDEEELRPPDDIAQQTEIALENLRAVLSAAGGQISDIAKVVIYNTDMSAQDLVHEVYTRFLGDHRPACSHIGVSRLVVSGLKIEIEAVAVID